MERAPRARHDLTVARTIATQEGVPAHVARNRLSKNSLNAETDKVSIGYGLPVEFDEKMAGSKRRSVMDQGPKAGAPKSALENARVFTSEQYQCRCGHVGGRYQGKVQGVTFAEQNDFRIDFRRGSRVAICPKCSEELPLKPD